MFEIVDDDDNGRCSMGETDGSGELIKVTKVLNELIVLTRLLQQGMHI